MGLLILLFVLAGLVWSIPIIWKGRLIQLVSLCLIAGTVFSPEFFAIDGPIQLSLDRFLWIGLLGLACVQWRLGNLSAAKMIRIDWLLLALAAYLLVSSQRGEPVSGEISPIGRWIFYVAMPLGTYLIIRVAKFQVEDVRWFKAAVLGLGAYLSVTALFEVAGMTSLVYPRYINDPATWEFLGRGRGPLLNPIANGMIMTIALVIAVLECIGSSRKGKLGFAILGLLIACGGYATLTRSVWIGMVAALGLIALIHTPRWLRVLGLAAAVLFGGALSMGLKDQLMSIKRDKALSAADAAKSVELRPLLAVVAWEMFKDKPIIGHGFGHYLENSAPYHEDRSYGLPLQEVRPYAQHNAFLMLLTDTGLVGFITYLGSLAMLVGIGWQLARGRDHDRETRDIGLLLLGTLAAYFVNAMLHDLVIIPMMQMFLFSIAGLAVTLYARGFAPSPTMTKPARRQSYASAVAASRNLSC